MFGVLLLSLLFNRKDYQNFYNQKYTKKVHQNVNGDQFFRSLVSKGDRSPKKTWQKMKELYEYYISKLVSEFVSFEKKPVSKPCKNS